MEKGGKKGEVLKFPCYENSHVIPRVEFDDGVLGRRCRIDHRARIATSAIGSCPSVRTMFDPPMERR